MKLIQTITYITLKPIFLLAGTRFGNTEAPLNSTIIASNHISMLDFLIVPGSVKFFAHLRSRAFYTMTANKYLSVPIGGLILKLNGGFPAKEHKKQDFGISKSVTELRNGNNVIIFPEGGLPIDGVPRKPKDGIVTIIEQTGALVLPVRVRRRPSRFLPKFESVTGMVFDAKEMSVSEIMKAINNIPFQDEQD